MSRREARLQRDGNSLHLRITRELVVALGIDRNDPRVTLELRDGALVVRAAGVDAPGEVPPKEALTPSYRAMLVALRDHGPLRAVEVAAQTGFERPSVSAALSLLGRVGLTSRAGDRWELAPGAERWLVAEPRTKPTPALEAARADSPRPFRDRLAAALDATPRTAVELAQALGVDRTQVHHAIKALEAAGVAVAVPGRPVRWRRP